MLQRILLVFSFTALLGGCGHSLSTLPGFDDAAWRADTRACGNKRAALLPALDKNRAQLYGARTGAVAELLGRPDEEELQEQGQRVYYYYVEPSYQCQPSRPSSNARRLMVRFGALGTAIEVLYTAPPVAKKA